MSQRLQNKVALVTGASRGIGAAITKRFAEEGASVAITYLKSPGPAEEVVAYARGKGVEAEAFQVDSGDAGAQAGIVGKVVERFGKLDILVNNAGIFDLGFDDAAFDNTVNVNVRAVYLTSREAANVMKPGSRIINIGSILGEIVPMQGISLYAMSKFAVAGLTKGMARDLGPKGITVNVIQPGPIDTDMNPASGDMADGQKAMTALGQYGKPEDIAALAAFLASSESGNITGARLTSDSGLGA